MNPESGGPSLPELFAHAVELDAAARSAFLAELAAREPKAARELERLLAGAGRADSPVDRSPWRALEPPADPDPEPAPLPENIGSFRIVRELGRGGMGRVFLAEEVTEDFRRTVALKVIDRPAFDADAVRRFREEVRILSSLEHPGIARFLDGGRAGDGTLYLALEYVEGEDLLSYATRHELPIRKRLDLFRSALEAVRHAHQRGVVHRDLKPSHLLVGNDGRPRLLDFGISKLVDRDAGAPITVTRTESRALTPAYASPEQFRGEPVSPASDVYALGGVLYELLTGKRPFAGVAGTGALERAVLEFDPEPPSAVARRAAAAKGPGTTRTTSTGTFGRDLDAICLKALRKNAAERYADAGELSDDIARYLEGLPVEARRGGRRYRLGRLLHRRRATLVTAAAIVLASAAGFYAWQTQRQVAGLRPVAVKPMPFPYAGVGDLPLEDLERRFAAEPADVEAGAALVLGLLHAHRLDEARLMVSRLRQIPGEAENPLTDFVDGRLAVDLEEPHRALVLYQRSLARAIADGRGDLVPQVRASRGRLLAKSGQRDEGSREMATAAKEFEAAGDHVSLSNTLNEIAIEHLQHGDYDQGTALLRRSIEVGKLGGASLRLPLLNLGILETLLGRPDRAVTPLEDLVASQRQEKHEGHLGQALAVLAHVYFDMGRTDDAEAAYEEGIPLLRKSGDAHSLRSAIEARTLMDIDCGRFDRVEAALAELENRAPDAGDYNATAWVARLSGLAAAAQEDFVTMRRELARARALLLGGEDTDQAAEVDATEALGELRAGRAPEAMRLVEQALSRLPADDPASEPAVVAKIVRARLEADAGRPAAAREWLAKAGAETANSTSLARRLLFLAARAASARAEGRPDEARRDLEKAIADAGSARRRIDERYLRRDLAELAGAPEAR